MTYEAIITKPVKDSDGLYYGGITFNDPKNTWIGVKDKSEEKVIEQLELCRPRYLTTGVI